VDLIVMNEAGPSIAWTAMCGQRLVCRDAGFELEKMLDEVIAGNPGAAADFRSGKEKAAGFLVGQVMRASKGKANPKMLQELLKAKLG